MSFFDQYKVNKSLAQEGVKFLLDPEDDDKGNYIVLAYSGASNPKFSSTVQRIIGKTLTKKGRLGKGNSDTEKRKLAQIWAEAIVQEWGGPDFQMECTTENVINLFIEYPEFFVDIQELSNDIDRFKEEYREEILKNS